MRPQSRTAARTISEAGFHNPRYRAFAQTERTQCHIGPATRIPSPAVTQLHLANGETVTVDQPIDEVARRLSSSTVTGFVELSDTSERRVFINPAHVTHVVDLGAA